MCIKPTKSLLIVHVDLNMMTTQKRPCVFNDGTKVAIPLPQAWQAASLLHSYYLHCLFFLVTLDLELH